MPRRPSKKSKNASASKPRKLARSDGKIKKWNNSEDIPMDEEDQFHASRDQILLEGDGEEEGDIEDDEVFALKGMSDDEEDEEEEEDDDDDDDDDNIESIKPAPRSKSKTKRKGKEKEKELSESEQDDSEEEEETWGRGKAAYYSSNAGQIESDDEEAIQLEEQEAKRLRAKSRDDMNDEDFGLEDPIEVAVTDSVDVLDDLPARPVLQDKTAILRHLQKTDPESLALAGDWTDSANSLLKIKHKLEQLESEEGSRKSFALGMMHLHYQTLLTYTTTLAFYLHLRASQKYAQKPELLRSHPVMQRLLKLKQSLITLEDLDFAASDDEADFEGDNDEDEEDEDEEEEDLGDEYSSLDEDEIMRDAQELWNKDHDDEDSEDVDVDVDSEELDDLLADARSGIKPNRQLPPTAPPKKKRKTGPESGKTAIPIFDLVEPEFTSSKISSSSHLHSPSTDAFGEATSLQHADAADKNARRKTLRFHTSRIESASARRNNARSNALGGDDDIPYRERKKEREDRLAREAKAHVRSQGGADLDDTEPEPRRPEGLGGDEDMDMEADGDGYYDLVKKQAKEKKEKKKADYEASRQDRYVEEETGSGPRSLTRAILSNKGLTPHRPKAVRNPRVKKRMRFDKAQKKVASQKAVYKGGVSATGGRYEGEKSGISKVVKSVRLG